MRRLFDIVRGVVDAVEAPGEIRALAEKARVARDRVKGAVETYKTLKALRSEATKDEEP